MDKNSPTYPKIALNFISRPPILGHESICINFSSFITNICYKKDDEKNSYTTSDFEN